jgi:beta-mannosidase
VRHWSAEDLAHGNDRYLGVHSGKETFPANRHFFGAIKDLDRQPATLHVSTKTIDAHKLEVTVEAPAGTYAYFVNIALPQEATRYSDNFIDLNPGELRTIVVHNPFRNTPKMF